jgi:ketosteroid isomerase-like protein
MESSNTNILSLAKQYLQAISQGQTGWDLAAYYAEKIQQIEYPNRLNAKGGTSDRQTLVERSEKGKQIVVSQSYSVQKEYVSGNTVILEVIWTGIFSVSIGQLAPGDEMKAYFALFMDFEDGKIIQLRNYDCFEEF